MAAFTPYASPFLDVFRSPSTSRPAQKQEPGDSAKGVSFYGEYEPLCGVPTRVIHPGLHSSFTCHAFSSDGTRLVTGEADGSISLWNTSDYLCITRGSHLFQHAVAAISFSRNTNDILIAVDRRGNVRECRIQSVVPEEGSSGTPGSACALQPDPVMISVGTSGGSRHPHMDLLRYQFSDDGRTLAHIRYHQARHNPHLRGTSVDVYRFDGVSCRHKIIPFEEAEISLPILSRNGKSLLASFFCKKEFEDENENHEESPVSEIFVVPEIDFDADEQKQVQLDGERATWGLQGEYLLLWDSEGTKPTLSIYKTETLQEQDDAASPLAYIDLIYGLTHWKAQILEQETPNARLQVLLYQISNDKRMWQIWDVTRDTVTREAKMVMPLPEAGNTVDESILETAPEIDAGPTLRVMSMEALSSLVVEDAFPKFCVSRDGNWLGAISSQTQSGILSSIRAGVTAWSFSSFDELSVPPFHAFSYVKFDPHKHHFLLFGDSAILAFAPTFLEKSAKSLRQMVSLKQTLAFYDDEPKRTQLLSAYRSLPSRTLAKIWQARANGKRRLLWFQSRRTERTNVGLEFQDASISPNGHLLALIVRKETGSSFVATRDSRSGEPKRHDEFAGLRFPRRFHDRETDFSPERVFLFEDANGEECMALLSTGECQMALFCYLSDQTWRDVDLPLKRCLRICQATNENEVLLLDEDSVSIFDLHQQQISIRILYNVNFSKLLYMVETSLRWRRGEVGHQEKDCEPRISCDGRSVLLAWDVKHVESIVASPHMRQRECEELIHRARGSLTDCCALFANGAATLFVNVPKIKNGCISIGIFNEHERKVLSHVVIDQSLPKGLSQRDKCRLLERISYGLCPDGTKLVAHTREMNSASSSSNQVVKDSLKVFGVHASVGCIPNYDLLTLARSASLHHSVEEVHERHGFSAFNTPSATGTTVFQEALIRGNKSVVNRVVGLAKDNNFELSMEWKSVKGESRDILQAALITHSTNEIKDAVNLVCSSIAPFRSSAAIMKKGFINLTRSHREIMEEVLSQNRLVHEACQMKVHVNYMNLALRRDTAVHIDTSNTCLDWSQIEDEESLEKTWKDRKREEITKMESGGNTSTTMASLKFVRIEDAAKTGMRGILRPMLLQKVPPYFYQFDIVKWIIMYKWLKIWRARFLWRALKYCFFLIFFSLYIISLSTSANFTDEAMHRQTMTSCLLGVTFVFGWVMTVEEIQKIQTYLTDGRLHSRNRWKGLHFFLMFGWNWLDLISCLLLTIFIPVAHILAMLFADFDQVLSSIVAVEAIVAFAKVWYYAQPFRVSGALVRMITDIVKDCLAFLVLASIIMLGFGLSLHVLFRHHVRDPDDEDDPVPFAFGTIVNSVLTMYYASLGNFDQQVYRSAGNLSWQTTITFMTYLLAQMIVLLNLLISIMGDTFDRVKDNEEAQLLIGRARFLDSCEASLSDLEREKIDKEVGSYLHVLEKVGDKLPLDSSELWTGRLRQLESRFRESINQSRKNMKKVLEKVEENILGKTKKIVKDLEESLLRQLRSVSGTQGRDLHDPTSSASFIVEGEELRGESEEVTEGTQPVVDGINQLSERMNQLETRFEDWQRNTDVQLKETLLKQE